MARNHKNIYESIAILCGGISLILSCVPVVVCACGVSNSLASGRLVVARIVAAWSVSHSLSSLSSTWTTSHVSSTLHVVGGGSVGDGLTLSGTWSTWHIVSSRCGNRASCSVGSTLSSGNVSALNVWGLLGGNITTGGVGSGGSSGGNISTSCILSLPTCNILSLSSSILPSRNSLSSSSILPSRNILSLTSRNILSTRSSNFSFKRLFRIMNNLSRIRKIMYLSTGIY